jgi:hypothetical protein
MKNLTLSLGRLTLILAGALSLGACNRAAYSNLSPTDALTASAPVAQPQQPQQPTAAYVPVAAEESAVVKATAPAAPAVPVAAPMPVVAAPAVVAAAPVAPVAPAATAAPTAPKPNLVQRLALRKITKKLDKMASQLPQIKKQDASAARGGLDSNLRSALLFGLIGIILLLFTGVSNVFGILGTILLIIGLVFLVLWLLDQA